MTSVSAGHRRREIGVEAGRGTMREEDKKLKTNNDGKSQETRLGYSKILAPNQPVGSGRPQRESNPGPPHQESRALPTELPRPSRGHLGVKMVHHSRVWSYRCAGV